MAINRATLRVENDLNQLLTGITDQHTRALVEAWATAWDQVVGELDAAVTDLALGAERGRVTRTMVIRSQRAQAGMEATAQALERLAEGTGVTIGRDVQVVINHAVRAEHDMIASQLTGVKRAGLQATLVRADPAQIAAMIERATQRITALSLPIGPEASTAIRRELLRGIAVGENPRAAARRMVRGLEDRFNGGLTRALVISRTELLDAARVAQQVTDAANTDVLAGWTWLAHLDPSTCRSCVAMHGSVHALNEPGPLDHQQGRCARVPKTKTWAELGFTGITDPPDSTPDADTWFAGLTADQQRGILGEQGHKAWLRGDYPRDQWSTRRTTDGWRDSMVPSRAPRAA